MTEATATPDSQGEPAPTEPAAQAPDSQDTPDTLLSGDQSDNKDATSSDSSDKTGDSEVGAPEEYTAFEMPEGMELDSALLDSLSPTFKEIGLTQDQAQSLVSNYSEMMQAQAESYQEEIDTILTTKMEEVKADAVLGGDNLQKTEQNIGNVFNSYGKLVGVEQSQALRDKFSAPVATGLGNDRDVVAFFNWIGGFMGENTTGAEGLSGNQPQKTLAEKLYGVK